MFDSPFIYTDGVVAPEPTVELTQNNRQMIEKAKEIDLAQDGGSVYDQLVAHAKKMGIVIHNKAEMDAFLKEHGIDDLQEFANNYYIDIEDQSEWSIVNSSLFQRHRNKSAYGTIARTANNWYLCDYFGKGSFKARAIMQIEGNEDFLNEFEKYARKKNLTFRSAEAFSQSIREFAARKGQHPNGRINVQVRRADNGNAVVDRGTLDGGTHTNAEGNNGRSTGNTSDVTITIKTGFDGTNNPRYAGINLSDIQELRLPASETATTNTTTEKSDLYGFVYNGEIYLDETKLSPNALIHEYTHLWDNAVMRIKPDLWKRGKRLMRQTSLWKEIENDENYGRKWKAQGKTEEETENLIASEVHSRLVGENGESLLEKIEKEQGSNGIVGKLKNETVFLTYS